MARTTPVNPGFTIVNGTGTGANGNRIDVWAEYAFSGSDPVTNTTAMEVYFYAALNPRYTSSTVGTRELDAALQVGAMAGSCVSGGAYDFRKAENIHLLGSFTGNIPHNADGTGTVSIHGSFTTASSYISGGNLSATVVLPAIARHTQLGATDCAIGKTSVIALSVQNPAYLHSIAYSFGQLQGYLTANGTADTETLLSGNTLAFSVPEAFYTQIPDATRGICTLTCRTYLDGVLVGQPQQTQFTVWAVQEDCSPLVSVEVSDEEPATLALTGDATVLIPGFSRVRCKISAQAQKSATIESISVAGVPVAGDTAEFLMTEDTDLTVSVTDSRGYGTRVRPQVTVLSYVPVTNLAQILRAAPTSTTATLTLSGSFWQGNFGREENTLTLELGSGQTMQPQWTLEGGRYYATLQLEGLDYTQVHNIPVTVRDSLSAALRTVRLQKGIPVFDWGEEDFVFHVPVHAPTITSPELTDILERLQKLEEKYASN